jgi:hypothetical protein
MPPPERLARLFGRPGWGMPGVVRPGFPVGPPVGSWGDAAGPPTLPTREPEWKTTKNTSTFPGRS